ncbi:GNAT family N-acetyltransferase [Ascidiimonas sp. W6]|uniref:GNAT family N-acetyltransferase n=1 Tax=Ascidiimonas meishanensis TaxID=3128903 RepID=UPI0030EDB862
MKIHMETERFLIRDLVMGDASGMFALDSDAEVHRYLGNKPIQTLEEAKKIIMSVRSQYEEYGMGRWAIINKKTNDFVGWTGLKYERKLRKGFDYYDLGYRLRKKYWGQGIGTETALASLQYGFDQLKLEKIGAAADVNNIGSNKILQKIGLKSTETFYHEDTLCNWYELKKTDWIKETHFNE